MYSEITWADSVSATKYQGSSLKQFSRMYTIYVGSRT